jgi:hypothetical protein
LLPNLQVVVFLVDSSRPSSSAGGYIGPHVGQTLLFMLCHSVVRLYEHARFTILTTPTTKLPELPFPTDTFARPVGNGPLLYERMRHYIAFLEQAPVDRTYLFLESDMLMLEQLRLEIVEDWDVAIAYKNKGMWINSGMLLVRAQRRDAALAFLRLAARLYEERYLNHPQWGADQAAIRDVLGLKEPPANARIEFTATTRVLLLPMDKFTRFAPWYARLSPPATWILHFTGDRKRTMPQFYWLHIERAAGGTKSPIEQICEREVPRKIRDIRRDLRSTWRKSRLGRRIAWLRQVISTLFKGSLRVSRGIFHAQFSAKREKE